MATIDNGTVGNGKIHVSRIRLPSSAADGIRRARTTIIESPPSLRSNLAKRVRDLAHLKRTSETAIIDCALWLFFDRGQDANLMTLMDRAGIAPRRRRA